MGKILIVDDNPTNIQVLANILNIENYDFEFAMNGDEALSWIGKETFDIVLLDVVMPGMDGYQVCREIKKNPDNENISIIFVTANADVTSVTEGFDSGGVDYVTKPFNEKELLKRVHTHSELAKSRKKLKDVNSWLEKEVKKKTAQLTEQNERLVKAYREISRLDDSRNEFLRMISHEIRTPLNGVIGIIDIIKQTTEDNSILEYLEALDISAKRLEMFSYKALDISAIRALGANIKKARVSISTIIKDSVRFCQQNFKDKVINIVTKGGCGADKVAVNTKYMEKCLINILENSIKFSPEQSTVVIGLSNASSNCIITISDEGPGFSKKILEHGITPFRGDIAQTELSPGLGLYLSKLIVESHEGAIEISNNKGKGAKVRLTFPVR